MPAAGMTLVAGFAAGSPKTPRPTGRQGPGGAPPGKATNSGLWFVASTLNQIGAYPAQSDTVYRNSERESILSFINAGEIRTNSSRSG